jgi:peptidoglycan/xylan/chitin deacetylase (PgdA/CDA1 family)
MRQTIVYHAKKHLSLAGFLLVVSVGIFAVLIVTVMVRPSIGGAKTATLRPREVPTDNFAISYPVFGVLNVDAAMKRFADTKTTEFIQKLGPEKYNPKNTFVLRYEVLYHDTYITTIRFTEEEQKIGVPTIVSRRTMTIDMKSGKELKASDLFTDTNTAQRSIGLLLYDYFKQHHSADFTPTQRAALLQFTFADLQDYWVEGSALVLRFDPKQLHTGKEYQTGAIALDLLRAVLAHSSDAKSIERAYSVNYTITEQPQSGDTIDPSQKMLALTFDDGPGGYTNRVLDALHNNRAHATFFVIGRQVPGYAATVKRTVDEGNEVGNHSWDHASLLALHQGQLIQEVDATQNAVRSVTGGYTPTQMRPPYGAVNGSISAFLHSQNLKVALWNVDTEDWRYRNQKQAYDRIMSGAGDGRVILLHDIHPTSVEAVERAIPELIAQGYQLVTLSQLEQFR